jgi:hypothetical protein
MWMRALVALVLLLGAEAARAVPVTGTYTFESTTPMSLTGWYTAVTDFRVQLGPDQMIFVAPALHYINLDDSDGTYPDEYQAHVASFESVFQGEPVATAQADITLLCGAVGWAERLRSVSGHGLRRSLRARDEPLRGAGTRHRAAALARAGFDRVEADPP